MKEPLELCVKPPTGDLKEGGAKQHAKKEFLLSDQSCLGYTAD